MRLLYSGLPIGNVCSYQSPYIPKGRCEVVHQFLQTDCDWLLFLDHDIVVEPEAIQEMLRYTEISKIISGIYYNLQPTTLGDITLPCIYRESEISKFSLVSDIPEQGFINISGAGFGLILIHRDVFIKMKEGNTDPWPWFGHDIYKDDRLSEDLTFFSRARDYGITDAIAVMSAKAKHIKSIALTSSGMGI